MINEIKKLMLASIGTAAVAYEKFDEFIEQMVEKGKITVEDGRELSEELKRNVEEKTSEATNMINKKLEEIKPMSREEINEILSMYNIVTSEQINSLNERVRILEEKVFEEK